MLNNDILDLTLGAIFWLVLTFAAAWAGARFMPDAWYARLSKPSWNPPESVYAAVWPALYLLMSVAAFLVWRKAGWEGLSGPLALYLAQLVPNAAWTWIFFGRHRPGYAFADLSLLWLLVAATTVSFWHVLPAAGALMLPYLAWISFAATLNYSIWRANPQVA